MRVAHQPGSTPNQFSDLDELGTNTAVTNKPAGEVQTNEVDGESSEQALVPDEMSQEEAVLNVGNSLGEMRSSSLLRQQQLFAQLGAQEGTNQPTATDAIADFRSNRTQGQSWQHIGQNALNLPWMQIALAQRGVAEIPGDAQSNQEVETFLHYGYNDRFEGSSGQWMTTDRRGQEVEAHRNDETSWCASFVSWVMSTTEQTTHLEAMHDQGRIAARDWGNYQDGRYTTRGRDLIRQQNNDPSSVLTQANENILCAGNLVVVHNNENQDPNASGNHVGFLYGYGHDQRGNYLMLVGGNQGADYERGARSDGADSVSIRKYYLGHDNHTGYAIRSVVDVNRAYQDAIALDENNNGAN